MDDYRLILKMFEKTRNTRTILKTRNVGKSLKFLIAVTRVIPIKIHLGIGTVYVKSYSLNKIPNLVK
jgi:hypothetical protein